MRYPDGNGKVTQAIKNNIDIVEYMERRGYTFKKIGSELYCKEIGSLCINPVQQKFYNHKLGAGGSIIDLVMMLDELPLTTAISILRENLQSTTAPIRSTKYADFARENPEQPKVFTLPDPDRSNNRLFAYLNKTRGIVPSVITDMSRRNMIYEESKYHNCVFVGFDYDGEPKYASVRSTGDKKFAIDVTGSTKKIGWFVDYEKSTLFVCEAPIDVMSIMSLLVLADRDYTQYSYLAQGGSSNLKSLAYHVQSNAQINKIYLCYDKDDAGQMAAKKAAALLKEIGFTGKVINKPPMNNDFNEDLKAHQSELQQMAKKNINNTLNRSEIQCNR